MSDPTVPEPPAAASKWISLGDQVQSKNLVTLFLLVFIVWWFDRTISRMEERNLAAQGLLRHDIEIARQDTKEAYGRCIARTEEKTESIKKLVADVKSEVRATGDTISGRTTPAPPTTPPSPPGVPP